MSLRRIVAQSLGGRGSAGASLLLGNGATDGPGAHEHPVGLLVNGPDAGDPVFWGDFFL